MLILFLFNWPTFGSHNGALVLASCQDIIGKRDEIYQRLRNQQFFIKKWANTGFFFSLFSSFQHFAIQIETDKSVDGVLGIQT